MDKQKRYATDLDHQLMNCSKDNPSSGFMTKHEKKLNSDNLQGWKNRDGKLYSAVPGWGSHVEYNYNEDSSNNKNLFQKISKRAPLAVNNQKGNSSCQMGELIADQKGIALDFQIPNTCRSKPVVSYTSIRNPDLLIKPNKKVTFEGIDSRKKYEIGSINRSLLKDNNIFNFDGATNAGLLLGGGRGRVNGRYLRDNFVGGS